MSYTLHPSKECLGVSGSPLNGVFLRVDPEYNNLPVYKAGNIFLWNMNDFGWVVSQNVGEEPYFAYNKATDQPCPSLCREHSHWRVFDSGGYKVCPSIRIIRFHPSPVSVGVCVCIPNVVVISGRRKGNTVINGGYRRINEINGNRPVYKNEEGNLYMYSDGTKWKISKEINSKSFFAKCSDKNASIPIEVNEPWVVAESGGEVSPDPLVNCIAFDEEVAALDCVKRSTFEDGKFTDPDFPPTDASLGDLGFIESDWIRGQNLNPCAERRVRLFHNIEVDNLLQGSLGDCWLLAAISAVSEFPRAIEDMFVTKEFSIDGVYQLRLYDVSCGKWIKLEVDDWIPCRKRTWWETGGVPVFAKPADNQLWCMLIEKAFAKFVGSYENLKGGHMPYALQCMTGEEKQLKWKIDRDNGTWSEWRVDCEFLKKNPRRMDRMYTRATKQTATFSEFFSKLVNFDENNFIMGASIGDSSEVENVRSDGIITRHAYSLCRTFDAPELGLRLLQLRNPWGEPSGGSPNWKGKWGTDCEMWGVYPEVRDMLYFRSCATEGLFWMCYEDFTSVFDSVVVCPKSMPPQLARRQSSRGIFSMDAVDMEVGESSGLSEEFRPRSLLKECRVM
eukprot:GHVR01143013.1.p1 GENE.GHVR01143013.1~~GHVR01143013.1.p1  ORF type:complete len:617 (-),score=104.11 GHVR01143013.1:164-2014(-)